MKRRYILVIFLIFSLSACEKLFFDEDPINDKQSNFEIFWQDMDKNYPSFFIKDIDWDSVYLSTTQTLNENELTDQEFYNLLSDIIFQLKDGHMGLFTPYGNFSYVRTNPETPNVLEDNSSYLAGEKTINQAISFAKIKGRNLGYLKITTFSNQNLTINDFKNVDQAISQLQNTDGMIIDLRSNLGGEYSFQKAIAKRFIQQSMPSINFKYRNGPSHNDLTDWIEDNITPEGIPYQKPIAILTNRATASAAELFILTLKGLTNVTIIGDLTNGSQGTFTNRELPNGWTYRMTTMIASNKNKEIFEGVG
ncbi:S41 family peptidase, partial [Xanthovirga aplysinae]|uniref:S41 family peptidase n=1 Tax=Xanthovirga aplysinae TaxID=2529853 RepID=UPI0012BCDF67